MLKTERKTIKGRDYEVTQLGAVEGRRACARLLRIAGPALGMLASNKGDVGAALGKLAEVLRDEDVDYFCELFAPRTRVTMEGKSPRLSDIFDLHFAGDYLAMIQWLAFALEVNFGNFFSELAPALTGKREDAA